MAVWCDGQGQGWGRGHARYHQCQLVGVRRAAHGDTVGDPRSAASHTSHVGRRQAGHHTRCSPGAAQGWASGGSRTSGEASAKVVWFLSTLPMVISCSSSPRISAGGLTETCAWHMACIQTRHAWQRAWCMHHMGMARARRVRSRPTAWRSCLASFSHSSGVRGVPLAERSVRTAAKVRQEEGGSCGMIAARVPDPSSDRNSSYPLTPESGPSR